MLKTEALVTTYLEMRKPPELRSADCELRNDHFEIRELTEADWRFNREMYFRVGENWKWIDKRPWTDQQWQEYATDPRLRTFAGYFDDKIAGYFELKRSPVESQARTPAVATGHMSPVTCHIEDEVEIAYFGLLPEFIGHGLGGELLTGAVENAWAWQPTPARVWVHTCNRDHPSALANYQARGFKIYKRVTSDL